MQQTRRPILFALIGVLLWAAAGYLFYNHSRPHAVAIDKKKYSYQISQSATSAAHYKPSDFYGPSGSPGADNTAYIGSLTDYVNAHFTYTFTGSTATELRYSYKADAVLHSQFSGKDSTNNAANVWTKKYPLLTAVTGSKTTQTLAFNRDIEIPFAEYAALATKFNTAYDVPLSSEVVVTYTVTVSGKADGVPFTNTQTSTVIAPLDQRVYKIAVKFNKADAKEVAAKQPMHFGSVVTAYELPAAVGLFLLGLALMVYGFRKQIIKSAYDRELARIYRYNAGIIIKARRPVSLKRLTIVDLDSFDDLLGIAEQTGMPIVANEPIDSVTRCTRFIITSGDTAYVFTLGGKTPKEDWQDDDDGDTSGLPQFKTTSRKSQPGPSAKPTPTAATKITVTGD